MLRARNQPVPDKYRPPPDPGPAEVFYLSAFNELSTCRQIGLGVGSIPWTAIVKLAKYYGFGDHLTKVLLATVRAMDQVYLEWSDKKAAEKASSGRQGKGKR